MKFLATLLLFSLVAREAATADDLKPTPTAQATGLVFRVEGGKVPLFLCGSVHLMTEQDYPLPAGYETAYAQSQRIVFEIAPAEMEPASAGAAFVKYGMLKDGTLDEQLTNDARRALKEWTQQQGVPLASLSKFQPWLVALMISQQSYQQAGMKSEFGLDLHFIKRLKLSDKSSEGLETLADQFGMLSGFDQKTQMEMIVQSVEEAKEAKTELEKFMAAWRAGDAARLQKAMHESFQKFPEIEKVLLHNRNARWLPKLNAYLASELPTMIIVGAGHLCGPQGVPALLTTQGFKVTAVAGK